MIPYFQWTIIQLGPITVYVWGLCVAIGIIAAYFLAQWFSSQLNAVAGKHIEMKRVADVTAWVVFAGIIGARIGYVITELSFFLAHPIEIFMIQHGGMSITGALLAGGGVASAYAYKNKLAALEYLDVAAFVLPLAMTCGRVGCFCIYDHPGIVTNSIIGQQFSDGIVRYNLGLLLTIHAVLLMLVLFFLHKKNPHRKNGYYTVVFLLGYSIPRFFLDFLRATDVPGADPRYFGLTFAQFTALASIVGAIWLWYTYLYDRTKKRT